MKSVLVFTKAIVLVLILASCSTYHNSAIKNNQVKAWKQKIEKQRSEKDKEFKIDLNSPMAGVARFYVLPEHEQFLNKVEFKVEMSETKSDTTFFSVSKLDDNWVIGNVTESLKIINDKLDENIVKKPVLLNFERFSFMLYPSESRLTVIVFDSERDILKQFEGLIYYEIDSNYAVKGRLEIFEKPEPLTVYTTRNEEKTYYRYAYVHFKIKGQELKLTVFKFALSGKDSKSLFIPFRDLTSGETTYGAGRYIDLEEPKEDSFVLDFNVAYNPLCNYSNGYNCPLAPAENILDCKIEAGEKTYPH